MKRMVSWVIAAGLSLAAATIAQAAPIAAGAARTVGAVTENSRALLSEVGYRHHRYHRRAYYGRPVYRQRYYARPVYYRPAYAAPAYYGYGPRCFIKTRTVYTWQGVIYKPVRVCRY